MNKKRVVVGSVILLLVVGVSWAMGFLDGKDPQIAELEQMRDKNAENMGQMDDTQRRAQMESFREKVGKLSDDQRKQFFESSRPVFQRMMSQRMIKFFAMSEGEQKKELDKWIDRFENRGQQRPPNKGGEGGPGHWKGQKDMSQKERDERHKKRLDRSSPEQRAQFDKFFDMLNKRREERGLPPAPGRGGRGRGPR